MKSKELKCRDFCVTAIQDNEKKWVEISACFYSDADDLEDLVKLTQKTLPFLEGGTLEDIEDY